MKILSFSSLYPNASQVNHGIFVENRLRHLVAGGGVDLEVMAPVPWFPSQHKMFGRYADFARAPLSETRSGIQISHPRYPVIPRFGMSPAPRLMCHALLGHVREADQRRGGIDLIDAHYYYPDGVAAVWIGKKLGIPVVVTARGTDITGIPGHAIPRRQIVAAADAAAASITVSRSLKDAMIALGCEADKIRVLRNGVDLEMFRPGDREKARKRHNVDGPVILSVGTLNLNKGHHLVIEALKKLPGTTLLIAGTGKSEAALHKQIAECGLTGRARLIGQVAHHDLADLYAAADILVLASEREGWPNVLLEAMACGTPVVATDVGGVAELVRNPMAGRLISSRTPDAIAKTLVDILADPPDRRQTRAYAERYSWDESSQGLMTLFQEVIGRQAAL